MEFFFRVLVRAPRSLDNLVSPPSFARGSSILRRGFSEVANPDKIVSVAFGMEIGFHGVHVIFPLWKIFP